MPRTKILAVLSLGIIALSFASILIRLTPAPSSVIATGRMLLASLLLTPFFLKNLLARRTQLKGLNWSLTLLSGLLLAAHFALWIESLKHTTVVSSVVLVAMNPIFVTLFASLILKDKLTWRGWLAITLGITGALLIAGPIISSARPTTGNLLALGGALAAAGYIIIGRKLRSGLSLINYIYPVYSTAGLFLLIITLVSGQRFTGYEPKTYLFIFLLALGPQLLGHTSFNWALGYLTAPVVAMFILGEPVGTTILAWILLRQPPTILEIIGGLVICVGIYLAVSQTQNLKSEKPLAAR